MHLLKKLGRRFAATAMTSGVMLAPLAGLAAPAYPDKPITLVSGFGPGGSTDIIARAIAPTLGKALGVPVIVEDRAGAAGIIGANHVAKAPPDGYTLLVTTSSPLVVLPHTKTSMPYDAKKDLIGITMMGITPEVLVVNPKVPATNLKELVALAKKRQVTISSSGNGGLPHLAIELLKNAAAGASILHVPYKSATPAVADVLAGHVDAVFVDLPALYPQVVQHQLTGITVANTRRSEFLPDLPTTVEQGFPSVIAVNWTGLFAPAKTPAAIVDKLHAVVMDAMKKPEVKKAMAAGAVEVSVNASPAEFQKFLVAEYGKWGKAVKAAGIEPSAE